MYMATTVKKITVVERNSYAYSCVNYTLIKVKNESFSINNVNYFLQQNLNRYADLHTHF